MAWREDRENVGLWRSEGTVSYGETEEEGNTFTWVGNSTAVVLIELLTEIPNRTNVQTSEWLREREAAEWLAVQNCACTGK